MVNRNAVVKDCGRWHSYAVRVSGLMAVVFPLLSGVGCGGRAGPKVEYVEGFVTLDGSPVAGASVGYSPVDRSVGLPASGKTDAQGRYRLTAVRGGREGAGTAVGDYSVSITKLEIVPPDEPQPPPPAWWNPSLGPKPVPVRSLIPEAYGESATSGLRTTVKAGRNTGPEFSFELRADYRADNDPPRSGDTLAKTWGRAEYR